MINKQKLKYRWRILHHIQYKFFSHQDRSLQCKILNNYFHLKIYLKDKSNNYQMLLHMLNILGHKADKFYQRLIRSIHLYKLRINYLQYSDIVELSLPFYTNIHQPLKYRLLRHMLDKYHRLSRSHIANNMVCKFLLFHLHSNQLWKLHNQHNSSYQIRNFLIHNFNKEWLMCMQHIEYSIRCKFY